MPNYYPLYFVTGTPCRSLSDLRQSPIAAVVSDIFNDDEVAIAHLPCGPGGNSGALVCVSAPGRLCEDFGYFPDRQQWNQSTDGVWVGWRHDYRVCADDLQRRHCPVSEFEAIVLADGLSGSAWEIPVLREPVWEHPEHGERITLESEHHRTSLNTAMFQNPDGSWKRTVTGQHSDLFEQSRQWFDWLLGVGEGQRENSFAESELFEYAIAVLSLHYRYEQHLHNALKGCLLQTDQVKQIVRISCGWQVIMRHIQKKRSTVIRQS